MSAPHTPLDPDVLNMLRQLTSPGEPDVLREVLQLFQGELPTRISALEAALSAGDLAGAGRAAHSIKGSSGNVGARALYAACKEVEDAARTGRLPAAREAMAKLRDESGRVLEAVRGLLA